MCLKKFIFSKFAGLEAYSGQLYYQINSSTGIFQRLFKLFKLTSRNCCNNNDYKMHMFKKSKLATTSTFKQVVESNRKSPDQTYSSIFFFSFDDTVPIPSRYPRRIFVINSFVNIVKIYIYRVAHKTQKYVCFYSFICKTFLLIYYISYLKVLMVYFQSICSLEGVQFSGSSLCKTKMDLFLMRPI